MLEPEKIFTGPEEGQLIRIRLQTFEPAQPTLLDVSAFLYDFNLLYEVGRLATDEKYHDTHFNRATFYRWGRPLAPEDKLRVESLKHSSPIELSVVLPAVNGAYLSIVAIAATFLHFRKKYAEGSKALAETKYYRALEERTKLETSEVRASAQHRRAIAKIGALHEDAKSLSQINNNLTVEGVPFDLHAIDNFVRRIEDKEGLIKFVNVLNRFDRISIKMDKLEIKLERKNKIKR